MSLDFEERTAIVTGGVQGMSDEMPVLDRRRVQPLGRKGDVLT
jgi:hypothetical protein